MSKQDRQGVRKASDIEQKYDLGKESTAIKLASDAQRAAEKANNAADEAKTASTQAVGAVASMQESVEKNATDIGELADRVETLENTTPGEGGTSFTTDETLTLKDGVLSVNRANSVEQDNTLPITSAAVFTEIGNIDALLKTI